MAALASASWNNNYGFGDVKGGYDRNAFNFGMTGGYQGYDQNKSRADLSQRGRRGRGGYRGRSSRVLSEPEKKPQEVEEKKSHGAGGLGCLGKCKSLRSNFELRNHRGLNRSKTLSSQSSLN